MINFRQYETTIAESLKEYLDCEVVLANSSDPIPQYPYVAYTVTTPMTANNGTWGEYEDGYKRKEIQQVWSFTVHSDDDTESKVMAMMAHDFFDEAGLECLNDNEIVVQRLGNITGRDNFITVGFEYRNGFDVTFAFMNELQSEVTVLEKVSLFEGMEVKSNLDELNDKLEERLDGDSVTVSTLEQNVKQAISDFDEIEKAIEEQGIDIPNGADTSTFGRHIRELGKTSQITVTKWTEADLKGGDS